MEKLTDAQAIALLRKHSTGDFGVHRWEVIESLITKGMIEKIGKNLCTTPAGRSWCCNNHMKFKF